MYSDNNNKKIEIMTTQEAALNGTVEIVKNWLSKGVSSEIAILKLNQSTSIELSKKIVRLAELAILN